MFFLLDFQLYKLKALDEAVEVSYGIYDMFTNKKGGLGQVSPQYHLTSTIDAKSIKATKPCTTTYKDLSGGVFSKKTNYMVLPRVNYFLHYLENKYSRLTKIIQNHFLYFNSANWSNNFFWEHYKWFFKMVNIRSFTNATI